MTPHLLLSAFGAAALVLAAVPAFANPEADRRAVADLDTAYQAAVARNDAEAMGRILHKEMILVTGNGRVATGEQLMEMARTQEIVYERQVEEPGTQTVRLWGRDTATVTALLWIKGVRKGQAIDRHLWFTDTYVRTPKGWRYAFGQVGMDVPAPAASKGK